MKFAPTPSDEMKRLDAVHRLGILDSDSEERFDRITRIAHYLFDIPSVLITLVDNDRVWVKSMYGCAAREEPREVSLCGHAISNKVSEDISSRLFEVLDAVQDARFCDNSLIVEKYKVRYYLGFVLQSKDHHNIGTLCMTDTRPRVFSMSQKKLFVDLGLIAESELNNYRVTSPDVNNDPASQLKIKSNVCIDFSPKEERVNEDLNTKINLLPDTLLSGLTEQEKNSLLNFLETFPTER